MSPKSTALMVVSVVTLLPFPAEAQGPSAPAQTSGGVHAAQERPRTSGDNNAEDFFAAGASADVDREVTGDAFAAGSDVRLRGAVRGDAILAGREVNIEGEVDDDLYAAGARLLLGATVKGNARLAGGRVTIAPRGTILGRAAIAGADVQILGYVGRTLEVYADRISVEGEVGGDLRVAARELRIGPGAQIGGRLLYHGANPADISPSAVIAGGAQYTARAASDRLFGSAARAAAWVGAALLVSSLLVVGGLLVLAAPQFSAQAAATVARNPIRSFALGFALLVSIPAGALVALATVVGIPLGLSLLLSYPILVLLGLLSASLAIGDRIAQAARRSKARPGAGLRLVGLVLALVLLALLISIPRAGAFLLLAAIAVGLGAWTLCLWRAYEGIRRVKRPGPGETRGEPR